MVFKNILKRVQGASTKQLIVASAFMVAMAGAVSLGLITKQKTEAAARRDCSVNSINYKNLNGGCGATTPSEFAADVRANNPNDLQAIYAHYGLAPAEYNKFVSTARMGTAYKKNNTIVVDGRVVATDTWSLGRNKKSYSKPVSISGKTYHASRSSDVFAADAQPVMVMFDAQGKMKFAVMVACSNPITGKPTVPNYACNSLNKSAVAGEKDTYNFSTSASAGNGAAISKVVYDFGDGTPTVTKTNPREAVKHKYAKSGTFTAKVTVYVKLPGNQEVAIPPTKCVTKVTVTPPPTPYYACTALVATTLNDKKTQFRFTVKTSQGNGATLKDADFTLDGTSTVTGVTTKDAQGNIYKDYTFEADGKEHTVVAKVNFNVAGGVQSKTCEAKITPEKQPVCPVPGKEHLPPDSPECVENCPVPGKEHLPKNSPECKEDEVPPVETPPVELPKTGMGSVLGIFAGTSAAGAVAHRMFTSYRSRREM